MILEIATAIGCPMRCSYCPQPVLDAAWRGPRLMTLDVFRACMVHTPKNAQVAFSSFCEPFLNPNCGDMIRWLGQHQRPWQIFTTTVGMSRDDADSIVACRPDRVTIHIPADDDKMRLRVTPEYVGNVRYLAEQTIAANLPLQMLCFGPMRAELSFLKPWQLHHILQSRCGGAWKHERVNGPVRCIQCPELDHPTLLPDGTVTLCCNDYALRHILGSLLSDDLQEILNSPATNAVREAMAGDGDCACRYCDYCEPV